MVIFCRACFLACMKARSFLARGRLGSWSLMICILNLRRFIHSWTPVRCEMKETHTPAGGALEPDRPLMIPHSLHRHQRACKTLENGAQRRPTGLPVAGRR